MSETRFVEKFGAIYEHSPWIAAQASEMRPFQSLEDLIVAFASVVDASTDDSKLSLLRAHPELAGKAAERGLLTPDSLEEQTSVGLNNLSANELATIKQFNGLYGEAFSFPFIIAVKNHSKTEIFEQMALRIKSCVDDEIKMALSQVDQIAKIRLNKLIKEN